MLDVGSVNCPATTSSRTACLTVCVCVVGGYISGQVVDTDYCLPEYYKTQLIEAWDKLVQLGQAEWVEKGSRNLPGAPENKTYFIVTLRVK